MASERSLAIYNKALTDLRLAFKATDDQFLKNHQAVNAYIDGLPKAFNTKKVYWISLVSVLKQRADPQFADALAAYKSKMDAANKQVAEQMETQEMTEREKAIFVEWPAILEAREKARQSASCLTTWQDYIILCLYTMIPPLRLDWSPVRVVETETDGSGNTLLVSKKSMTFILKEYKTARKYGEQRITLPKPLEREIRNWLTLNPSGWLLVDANGDPLSEKGLQKRITDIMTRLTGKAAGVNIFRHSFVSYQRRGEKPLAEQKKLASGMLHSVAMSQLYRRL